MYPHGGSYNHGCEAIVKTTAKLMQEIQPEFKNNATLLSYRTDEDKKFGVDEYCRILPHLAPVKRLSPTYFKGLFKRHILGDQTYFDRAAFKNLTSKSDKDTLALSIGGDNYCYGIPKEIYFMNQLSRGQQAKTVLWGCSIEPSAMDDEMLEDLKKYDLIFARESITYGALKANGLTNMRLCPDPAFLLEPEEVPLPDNFIPGQTIGINMSPLITKYELQEGVAFKNFQNLIKDILEKTPYHISLIPHVMWDHNDDRIPLKKLYESLGDKSRVSFIAADNTYNCSQLKYVIGQCKAFIPARTHASIAAYSQEVPTLVVGYSVKAKGIAKDLFGTEEGYVLPVQDLKTPEDLSKEFFEFMDKAKSVKGHLAKILPAYKKSIKQEAKVLNKLKIYTR